MEFIELLNEFPVIETSKVRLRQLKEADAFELAKYYSNEKVYQYLDWNGPENLEHALKMIKIWNKGYENGQIIRFAIADEV